MFYINFCWYNIITQSLKTHGSNVYRIFFIFVDAPMFEITKRLLMWNGFKMQFNKDWKINLYRNGHMIIYSSSKGHIYKNFKSIFGNEEYLRILTTKYRKTFARFRTSNHHLLIETGRSLGILINERRCFKMWSIFRCKKQIPLNFGNWCHPW